MKEGTSVIEFKKKLIAPKPVRVSLTAIRQQFDRCSRMYMPIYHQLFEPCTELDLSPFDGDAVCRAFRDTFIENFLDRWDEWHASDDVGYFGRFFGSDRRGLGDFKRLAESAHLVLCEVEPSLPDDGYYGWIRLLHEMAFNYPTPLLRSENDVWGKEVETGPFDEYELEKCGQSEDGTSYPLHPFYWVLDHDVYAASMAAIDLILDDEAALLVGDHIGEFPVSFSFLQVKPDQNLEQVADEASFDGPILEFRFDGMWHIKFDAGQEIEEATLSDQKGYHVYRLVIEQKQVPTIDILAKTGQETPVRVGKFKEQDVIDEPGLRSFEKRVVELRREIHETINPERKAELEDELKQVCAYQSASIDNRGRPRTIASDLKNATNRIHGQLRGCRKAIVSQMPKFAAYLEQTVHSDAGVFVYTPLGIVGERSKNE